MNSTGNGVLIYKTRYGSTEQYAAWIKDELRIPMIDPERMDDRILSACDFLVIGTPVYFGEMPIKDWLWENTQRLIGKRLFFFIVCTYYSDVEKQQAMIYDNVPIALHATCRAHFLPGRLAVERLSPQDARLLALAKSSQPGRANQPAEEYAPALDIALKKENITAVVESVRRFG